MGKELFDPNEPITVELLAQKLQEVRDAADARINDMQSQLNKLREQIKTSDAATAKRLERIAERIDTIFDNLQQMVGCLDELARQLKNRDTTIERIHKSAMTNKSNINRVGDYLKEVDKALKELKTDVDGIGTTDKKISATLLKLGFVLTTISCGILWICKTDKLDTILEFLSNFCGFK